MKYKEWLKSRKNPFNHPLVGKRVRLKVKLNDPYTNLKPGDEGTIVSVWEDGINMPLDVKWDKGNRLSVFFHEVEILEK